MIPTKVAVTSVYIYTRYITHQGEGVGEDLAAFPAGRTLKAFFDKHASKFSVESKGGVVVKVQGLLPCCL